ncbi:hypothetical protein VB734_03320 [Synechococcus sp. BA-124 BA4]|jgi:acyl-CoA synthetase (AMP-forming)/AMP-acid ligase II|uniref:hypothetical protein n=1 Tax=unclassified Synechococcus TaxID=2626047 RepID=UPI0018CE5735|nr:MULTISPECIES: hypothetical protein [unclassified Synechococcus]MEA5399068.1 hypothetical protein [Synechococcus sp. BA-124 BA4]QPN55995.1 hypothetical protein I1E95_12785 [Synechococcus sp. CBW1107]CAK6699959.1 hypothetical protein BBFGKLBO_02765 [Synechococcus sp. CBW1107]
MVLEDPLAVGLVAMIGIHAPVHGETVRAYVTLHPEQPARSGPDQISLDATDRIDHLALLQLAAAALRVD